MDLGTKLTSVPHREVAGSDAFAAFEFQLIFGVEVLFENFDKLDDYAVLFEFHDDVVLLTGTDHPTEIEFFQVKHTTSGNWTIPQFCRRQKNSEGAKKQSMLHKLYGNVENFSEFSKNAQIVSNAYYSDIGQNESTKFNTLEDESRKKILAHIQDKFPSASADCLSVLGFRRTELQKSSALDLVKGRVHTFLQEKIGGDSFQLQACTNAIVSQCRIRNKKLATDVKNSVQEIIHHKGLTKNDVLSWLKDIEAEKKAPDWSVVQPLLGQGMNFSDLNDTRKAYDDYRIKALDAGNGAQNSVVRHVKAALNGMQAETPLWTFMEALIQQNKLMNIAKLYDHTASELRAIVIYEIFKSE